MNKFVLNILHCNLKFSLTKIDFCIIIKYMLKITFIYLLLISKIIECYVKFAYFLFSKRKKKNPYFINNFLIEIFNGIFLKHFASNKSTAPYFKCMLHLQLRFQKLVRKRILLTTVFKIFLTISLFRDRAFSSGFS